MFNFIIEWYVDIDTVQQLIQGTTLRYTAFERDYYRITLNKYVLLWHDILLGQNIHRVRYKNNTRCNGRGAAHGSEIGKGWGGPLGCNPLTWPSEGSHQGLE